MNSDIQTAAIACFAVVVAVYFVTMMWRRHRHDRTLWMLVWTFLTGAAGFTLRLPEVFAAMDRLLGVPNLAALLSDAMLVLTATFGHLWVMHWPEAVSLRGVRTLVWSAAGVIAALSVLFALGTHPLEARSGFEVVYLNDPATRAMTLVYLAAYNTAYPWMVARCRAAHSRLIAGSARWAAAGMRLILIGFSFAVLYALAQAAVPLAALAGSGSAAGRWSALAGNVFAALASTLCALGATCAIWGPYVERRQARRRYRALTVLWEELRAQTTASPLANDQLLDGLSPQTAADLQTLRNKDGYRSVQPYLDARVAQAAGERARELGYGAAKAAAIAQAAVLRAGLRAQRRGRLPARRHEVPAFGVNELAQAARWQVEVSRALARVDRLGRVAPRRLPAPARLARLRARLPDAPLTAPAGRGRGTRPAAETVK